MKITKAQLKEMVREVVRKKLNETMSLDSEKPATSAKPLPLHMSSTEPEQNKFKTQRERQNAKQTTRGMELECGMDSDVDDEEEGLSNLERLILQMEQ